MSLLPYILGELDSLRSTLDVAPPRRAHWHHHDLDDLLGDVVLCRRPALMRLLGQPDTTMVLTPRQLRRHLSSPSANSKQLKKALKKHDEEHKDDGFHVNVDVQQFKPEELSVQVLKDEGFVVVEGSHEERPDEHGYIKRQFTRRYKLPANVDPDTVTSRLSPDGVLLVSAPRKDALPAPKSNVRHIAITQSELPAADHQPDEKEAQGAKGKDDTGDEKMEP